MGRSILIDPGHGGPLNNGGDPGACGNEMLEKDINLNVSLKLKNILEGLGITVYMSRTDDSKFVSLNERTNMANKLNVDCLLSIHCNAANSNAYGVETFCYKFAYRKLADCIQNEIISAGLYNSNRGTKEGDLHMIRESNMDAALVELAFIDNTKDAELLRNKQDEFAVALAKGVCRYLGVSYGNISNPPVQPPVKPPVTPEPSLPNIDVFYKVYAGGVWYDEVKNLSDYAGVYGNAVRCVMARPSSGTIEYRVSPVWQNYYPWVRNYNDFAGLQTTNIDRLQMRLVGMPGYQIKYRVKLVGGDYLPWVYGESDFAGIQGRLIDAVQIEIIKK